MSRRKTVAVVLATLALAVGAAIAALAPLPNGQGVPRLTPAADLSQFQAGNIISDQLFFDGNAMTAGQVQTFLNSVAPSCQPGGDGTVCLKNYAVNTPTVAPTSTCPGGYTGAAPDTAAQIIAKVGRACGVSQKVLLTILQKEQHLVTDTGSGLYAFRYTAAMGFGCPDTASCNPAYAGFFNQVYAAAKQYKLYAANPGGYGTLPGITNQVRFNPSASCGTSPVFVQNQATAGLYDYTPYQPNRAALAAGYGSGDSCSAYGNRNFWLIFTDWFGSTQIPGAGQVTGLFATTGGATGPLGGWTSSVVCGLANGGCYQPYANGSIYWSPASGAHVVMNGAVKDKWAALSWERGALGYPTGDTVCNLTGGGCFQAFQGGVVYSSPATGAHTLGGPVLAKWGQTGWERGALGYPTSDQTAILGGQGQFVHFQSGSIYWSGPSGAHIIGGAVRDKWGVLGWEGGVLGMPVSDLGTSPDGSATYAHFQNGSIYATASGAHYLLTAIRDKWGTLGWERGSLGYPVADQTSGPNGNGQAVQFQSGWIYSYTDTGAHVLSGAVRDAWLAAGADGGALGEPTSDQAATTDGHANYAHFENASLYVHDTLGTRVVPAAIRAGWAAAGWEQGVLGYPTADASATADGRGTVQTFQGGEVVAAPSTGSHAVPAALLTTYTASGGPTGTLGLPTSDSATTPDGLATYQHFEGGSVYRTGTAAFVVPASVRSVWSSSGWETGSLGYPTGAAQTVTSGASSTVTTQPFQGGTVFVTGSGGHAVPTAFLAAVNAAGGTAQLGYPVSDVGATTDGTGTRQRFQTGVVYSSGAVGAHALTDEIETAWLASGADGGLLGWPVTDVAATPDGNGRYAAFQNGSVYWTQATGAHILRGPVRDSWASEGWERGPLGYPTGDVTATPDGKGFFATFQHGSLYWSPGTGGHWVSTALRPAWASWGWEGGALGYPVGDTTTTPDGSGAFAWFQGGAVYWSQSTGARVLAGHVLDKWGAVGWERSSLGYPTSDAVPTPDGLGQYAQFQNGAIYWTQATGAHVVSAQITPAWAAAGWERGWLGYPIADVTVTPDSVGSFVRFQNGSIYASPATGAHPVAGAIRDKWGAAGWEGGLLGYPVRDQSPTPDRLGTFDYFQRGAIYWSRATGAHIVRGAILDAWAGTGWERGRLGYPTSDVMTDAGGGGRQTFQHGTITVDSGGVATVQ